MADKVNQIVQPSAIESEAIASRDEVLRVALQAVDESIGNFGVLFVIEETGADGKPRQRVTRDRKEAVRAAAAGRAVHIQLSAPALARLAYLAGISISGEQVSEEISRVGDYLVVTRHCGGFRITIWMDQNLSTRRVDATLILSGPTGVFMGHGTTTVSERGFSNEHAMVATAVTRAWSNAVSQALGGRNRPARFSEEELLLSRVRTAADLVLIARQFGIDEATLLKAAGKSKVADISPADAQELAVKIVRGELTAQGQ